MVELSSPEWRRSSHCAADSCVEVAIVGDHVAVRNSKDIHGQILLFDKEVWGDFLVDIREGAFDFNLPVTSLP